MNTENIKSPYENIKSPYEIRDVVCDYGIYEDGELKLILNSYSIAKQIVELLEKDDNHGKERR